MIITEIKPQIKNKERVNIYVNNKYYCSLTLKTVLVHKLKTGTEADESFLSKIQLESEKDYAFNKALNLLSRFRKTKAEIKEYLAENGFLEETVNYVLEKLDEYKFINDKDIAVDFAKNSEKYGKRLIEYKLKRRGVSEGDIAEGVESIEDESERAVAVLTKYLKGKPDDYKTKTKAFKYLISKGFDYETAKAALQRVGNEDYDG